MKYWYFVKFGVFRFPGCVLMILLVVGPDWTLASSSIQFRADHMVLDSVTDGNLIYTATQDGKINRFSLEKRQKIPSLIELPSLSRESFPPAIFSLDLSPSNKVLASGDAEGQILIFNTISSTLLKKI
ncbi:MAG: hypothetical protein GY786_04255, partial [Proteobacteria bacterium]|nr:hypothetical protein [Pseudomonadota bacterium]